MGNYRAVKSAEKSFVSQPCHKWNFHDLMTFDMHMLTEKNVRIKF